MNLGSQSEVAPIHALLLKHPHDAWKSQGERPDSSVCLHDSGELTIFQELNTRQRTEHESADNRTCIIRIS